MILRAGERELRFESLEDVDCVEAAFELGVEPRKVFKALLGFKYELRAQLRRSWLSKDARLVLQSLPLYERVDYLDSMVFRACVRDYLLEMGVEVREGESILKAAKRGEIAEALARAILDSGAFHFVVLRMSNGAWEL